MALAAAQTTSTAGITPGYNQPLATELITPYPNQLLHVKNANASPCVVTLTDPGLTPSGSAATNPSVSVPATTGDRMIALPATLAGAGTGTISVTFSVQTSVTAALIRAS